jgi:hypothetical protein
MYSLRVVFLYLHLNLHFCQSNPTIYGYKFVIQQTNITSHSLACKLHGLNPTDSNVALPISMWDFAHASAVVSSLNMVYNGRKGCCSCVLICDGLNCTSLGYGCNTYQNLNGNLAHKALEQNYSPKARLVYSCKTQSVAIPQIPAIAPSLVGIVEPTNSNENTIHIFGNNIGNDASLISVFLGQKNTAPGLNTGFQCNNVQVCHGICNACNSPSDCLNEMLCVSNKCVPRCSETPKRECPCGLKCAIYSNSVPVCAPPEYFIESSSLVLGCKAWLSTPKPKSASDHITCSVPSPVCQQKSTNFKHIPIHVSNVGVISNDPPLTFNMEGFKCSSSSSCNDFNFCTKDVCTNDGCCTFEVLPQCSVGSPLNEAPPIKTAALHYMMIKKTIDLSNIVLTDDKINAMLPGFLTNAVDSNAGSVDDSPTFLVNIGFPFLLFQQSSRSKIYLSPNGVLQRESDTPCGSRFSSSLTQVGVQCTLIKDYMNMLLPLGSDFDPSSHLESKIKYHEMNTNGVNSFAVFYVKVYPFGAQNSPDYTFGALIQPDGTIRFMYVRTTFPVNKGQSIQGIRGPTVDLSWIISDDKIQDGSEFTFCKMPSVSCLTPACGLSGTQIHFKFIKKINCGGYLNITKFKCLFADIEASATLIDPHTLSCTVPTLPGSMFESGLTASETVQVNLIHGDFDSLSIYQLTSTELGSFTFTYSNKCDGAEQSNRCGGPGSISECNSCGACSDNSSAYKDCNGVCFGDSNFDCNGICGGSAVLDCNGICGGSATIQDCLLVPTPSSSFQSGAKTPSAASTEISPSPIYPGLNNSKNTNRNERNNGNTNQTPTAEVLPQAENALIIALIGIGSLIFIICGTICVVRNSEAEEDDEDISVYRSVVAGLRSNRNGGLHKNHITLLPVIIFSADSNIGEYGHGECAICLGDFEVGDRLRKLPCAHRFHADCIDPWFLRHTTCPTCKAEIREGLGGLTTIDAGAVVGAIDIEMTEIEASVTNNDLPH